MNHTTKTALLALLALSSAQATTVLEVNFSNLTEGVNVVDGDRIEDTSGNGYHGFFGQTNATGTAVVTTDTGVGIDNSAAGGVDGYVFIRDELTGIPDAWDGPTTTVSPYFNLDGNGSFTLEAVLNWNSTSQTINGIMGQTGGNQAWVRENGGFLDYAIGASDAVASFGTIDISAAKADGNYHGIAIVYNGTAGEVRAYLDGIQVGATNTDADIGTLGSLLNGTSDFRLGSYNGNDSQDFNGIMDQFRVSDTALAPNEFLAIPEPSTVSLLALFGLVALHRRR